MKQNHLIFGLIGIGAVALLIYLMKQSGGSSSVTAAAPASAVAPAQNTGPSYPNANPIQMGDFEVGGSPINLTYNTGPQLPKVKVAKANGNGCGSGCGGCDKDCTLATALQTIQSIPEPVLQQAQDNLNSYTSKGVQYYQLAPGTAD